MEEIMTEKVDFLKDNKDALINNFCSINYPLVKILVSDQSLEELDEYNQILDVIENTEIKESNKEVKDIIYYLVGISNKLSMYNRDYSCSSKLHNYLPYLEKGKTRIKRRISA